MKPLFTLFISGLMILNACNSTENKSEGQLEPEVVEKMKERVRPAAKGGTTAAYFKYKNELNITDTLLSVSSDIAETTQFHESYETDDGMMGMRKHSNMPIQAGEEITFQQGGLHVMLMGLKQDLSPEDSVKIILNFSQAGEISRQIAVSP